MVAFRRPKSLKDILVHSEMATSGNDKGCCSCGCCCSRVCDFLLECMDFRSRVTGNNFVINFNVECNSDHIVYLLSCTRCEMQYAGSTITKFRTRFNKRKSRLNAHRRLTAENKTKDDFIYRHFSQPDHQGLTDVKVRLIDKCYNEARLRDREAQWAYRLRTIHPLGLNSDDFFCSHNPRRDLY